MTNVTQEEEGGSLLVALSKSEEEKKQPEKEEEEEKGEEPLAGDPPSATPKPTGGKVGVPLTLPSREPPSTRTPRRKSREKSLPGAVKRHHMVILSASVRQAQVATVAEIASTEFLSRPPTNPKQAPPPEKPNIAEKLAKRSPSEQRSSRKPPTSRAPSSQPRAPPAKPMPPIRPPHRRQQLPTDS